MCQKHHTHVGTKSEGDEDAKILALKSIMPESVRQRRSFNFYADLHTAVINYLDDKVPVSMVKQGPPISTTNMVQTLSTGQGGDDEMKHEVTKDEIFAMVQQFGKGKVKGKGKGRMKGVCWKCGDKIARLTNKTTAGQMMRHGRIREAARQAKMQAKDGMQARAIGTAGETVRARQRLAREWKVPRLEREWSTPASKGKSSTKGSSKGINSFDDAGDIEWWAQSDGSQHSSPSEEAAPFCMQSQSKVQNQRHEVHQKEDRERMDTRSV